MTDHIREQISAFVDDELSFEESSFLVRRLGGDKLARAQTIRYATVGSVLRDESILANSEMLRDRINAALDGVPAKPVKRNQVRYKRNSRRILLGSGIAATIAVAAVLGLRMIGNPVDSSVSDQAQADVAMPIGARGAAESFVMAGDSNGITRVSDSPIRLTNYLVQHGSHVSTLQRTSVHSNVVGIAQPASVRISDESAP